MVTDSRSYRIRGIHYPIEPWLNGIPRKTRQFRRIHTGLEYLLTDKNYAPFDVGSIENLLAGYYFRIATCKGKPQPTPNPAKFQAVTREFVEYMLRHPPGYLTRLTQQQVIDHQSNAKKRRTCVMACEDINSGKVDKLPLRVKAFIKVERTELKLDDGKITAQPRVISPMPRMHRVRMAQFFGCSNEKIILRYIDNMFALPTIMKGHSLDEVGELIAKKWRKFTTPVFIALDCSRFDAHCNVQAFKYVEQVLSRFVDPAERKEACGLVKALRKLKYMLFTEEGHYTEVAPHTVLPSGCTITSLFAITLVCSILYHFHIKYGWEFIDNGDDFGIIMELADIDKLGEIEQHFSDVGQEVVAEEPVYVLEHIDFCQTRPVFNGSIYTMVRDPKVACVKDCIKINRNITDDDWRYSVSTGGMILNNGIPVMYAFYKMLGRGVSNKAKIKRFALEGGMRMWLHDIDLEKHPERVITHEARVSFAVAFNVSVEMQLALEQHFNRMCFQDT